MKIPGASIVCWLKDLRKFDISLKVEGNKIRREISVSRLISFSEELNQLLLLAGFGCGSEGVSGGFPGTRMSTKKLTTYTVVKLRGSMARHSSNTPQYGKGKYFS